jgi:uncharacterized protein (TIGR00369 family)
VLDPSDPLLLERLNQVLAGSVIPHNTALGLTAVACGPKFASVKLPYDAKLVGNPDTGVLHGGAITSLIDATCGLAMFMTLASPMRIATLDLRIDYLRPATPGLDVVARAECYRVAHEVAFLRAVAHQGDPDDAVASAAATFMLFREEPSVFQKGLDRT